MGRKFRRVEDFLITIDSYALMPGAKGGDAKAHRIAPSLDYPLGDNHR